MITRIRSVAVVGLIAALAGCASMGIQTNEQKIALACAGASASIDVLTAAHDAGKLSTEDAEDLFDYAYLLTPICAAEEPPTLTDVQREAFMAAIKALQDAAVIATEVKR